MADPPPHLVELLVKNASSRPEDKLSPTEINVRVSATGGLQDAEALLL